MAVRAAQRAAFNAEVVAVQRAADEVALLPPLLAGKVSHGETGLSAGHERRVDLRAAHHWLEGKLVKLRPTEYRLLYHLVQNAGWVVSHDQLLQKVWGYEYRDEPHYVRLYINYLRQKLEKDPADPKYILTERGVGYRFVDFRREKT